MSFEKHPRQRNVRQSQRAGRAAQRHRRDTRPAFRAIQPSLQPHQSKNKTQAARNIRYLKVLRDFLRGNGFKWSLPVLGTNRRDKVVLRLLGAQGFKNKQAVEDAMMQLVDASRILKEWNGITSLVDVGRAIKAKLPWARAFSAVALLEFLNAISEAHDLFAKTSNNAQDPRSTPPSPTCSMQSKRKSGASNFSAQSFTFGLTLSARTPSSTMKSTSATTGTKRMRRNRLAFCMVST